METAQEQIPGTELGRQSVQENGPSDSLYISLSQAAKRWGKSKNTLSVDLAKGKLQWVEREGKRSLMLGQLVQLYGLPLDQRTSKAPEQGTEIGRPKNEEEQNEINVLRAVLKVKEEQIALLKDQLEREQEQIERERLTAERWHSAYEQVKMLPAPTKENDAQEWRVQAEETAKKLDEALDQIKNLPAVIQKAPKRKKFLGLF
jgi:hypothetical protein